MNRRRRRRRSGKEAEKGSHVTEFVCFSPLFVDSARCVIPGKRGKMIFRTSRVQKEFGAMAVPARGVIV